MTDLNSYTGAVFSDDHKYRYALWRKWRLNSDNHVMFIGLNPSRANETYNDLTITKLIHFSKKWGFDGMYMANLFSIINPKSDFIKDIGMLNMMDYIGPHTEEWLNLMRENSNHVVFCWGDFKNINFRSDVIAKEFSPAWCFGYCKSGAPKHPVRLGYKTQLQEYKHKKI